MQLIDGYYAEYNRKLTTEELLQHFRVANEKDSIQKMTLQLYFLLKCDFGKAKKKFPQLHKSVKNKGFFKDGKVHLKVDL